MDDQSQHWWQTSEMQGGRALILSSLAFSLMTVCVKQLGGRLPVSEIVLVRSLVSIGLTGGAMLTSDLTRTISLTGSRPSSCLTQTVIKLKASELRIRALPPCISEVCHQGLL